MRARSADGAAPLADVRIVSVERYGADPWGAIRLADPGAFDGERPDVRPGPGRGADTADLLRSLCGYGDERIAELAGRGVFGDVAVGAAA